MKLQNIAIALMLIVGGSSLPTAAETPPISRPEVAAADIDFVALHREAREALDNLRRLHERRSTPHLASF